jgi:kynurenine 3-monooxygenase
MAEQRDPQTVTVVGAGLAGPLMACYLARAGYRVDLYERRPDPRLGAAERGRSINLALSVRGIEALRDLGLADEVLRSGILMRGRMIHHRDGSLAFQPYGKDDSEALHSVSRAGLNLLLVQAAARHPSVRLFFEHRCVGLDLDSGVLEFATGPAGEGVRVPSGFVIGADGAYSAVRSAMQRRERFDYSQEYLGHGYKELTIPSGPGGSFRMEKHTLHIWPRGGFMMIALPNPDGSFTCTLFWEFEGPRSFAATKTDDQIRRFFDEEFPDAVSLMPSLLDDFKTNPTGSLVTIRCAPWFYKDKVALVGDAAHAVVPFYGQGMNAAFEDCVVLDECLAEFPLDRQRAFAQYFARRKENADALADLAVQNFIEMRDKTASRVFRAKKKLDHFLEAVLPGIYLPLYTMVTFTRIPYAEAARRARFQDKLIFGALSISILILLFILGLALT